MADIVEHLRNSANIVYYQDGYTFRLGLQNEAADEIERLRGALKQIYERSKGDDSWLNRSVDIRVIVHEAIQGTDDVRKEG